MCVCVCLCVCVCACVRACVRACVCVCVFFHQASWSPADVRAGDVVAVRGQFAQDFFWAEVHPSITEPYVHCAPPVHPCGRLHAYSDTAI